MRRWPTLLLLLAGLPTSAQDPVLDLDFDQPLTPQQVLTSHAAGEGPALLPGPWDRCLDLTASARAGGSKDDGPSGGSVAVTEPALDKLTKFTVLLWVEPSPTRPIASRVINKDGSWELMNGGTSLMLYLTGAQGKTNYGSPRIDRPGGGWVFFAGTVDEHEVRIQVGTARTGLSQVVKTPLAEPLVTAEGLCELGNFRGIRPFQGRLDNLRIYGQPLPEEAIEAAFKADCQTMNQGGPLSAVAAVPAGVRGFTMKHSSVPFSSRWQRKPEELVDLLQVYGVTHLLWVYGNKPDFIAQMHGVVPFYEGSLNGMQGFEQSPVEADAPEDTTGRQRDFDGHFIVMSHMAKWSPKRPHWQACNNHPDFRQIFFAAADGLLAAGADAIHIDDWEMSLYNVEHGRGCFCPACLKGFGQYLQQHFDPAKAPELELGPLGQFDYRQWLREHEGVRDAKDYRSRWRELPLADQWHDYQRAGLRDFYLALREHLKQQSPDKLIPVSVNNQFGRRTPDGGLRGVECLDALDFFIGEASQNYQGLDDVTLACKAAEAVGITQVMMSKPLVLGTGQAGMATCYALGSTLRVPWDAYMDNGPDGMPAPRYFGQTGDWSPLYRLVADHPDLFEGYDTAASVGLVFNADEPVSRELQDACAKLTLAGIPFRCFGATSHTSRVPLQSEPLARVPMLVALTPDEAFCAEDQATLAKLREARTARWLSLEDALAACQARPALRPIRLEAPQGVYAWLRLAADDPRRAVVHLVNWNADPSKQDGAGDGAEQYGQVTVSLHRPAGWSGTVQATCYAPGAEPLPLTPELHHDLIRLTLPKVGVWSVVALQLSE